MPRDESGHSPPLQFHRGPNRTWSDERLIRGCLNGDDRAWSALLEKYRNLIYSIPMKYGASREDAADIFQAVSLELFSELPRLRKQSAFRSWLITITAHASLKWKRKQQRRPEDELPGVEARLDDDVGGAQRDAVRAFLDRPRTRVRPADEECRHAGSAGS